jgi:hypothetical protein
VVVVAVVVPSAFGFFAVVRFGVFGVLPAASAMDCPFLFPRGVSRFAGE